MWAKDEDERGPCFGSSMTVFMKPGKVLFILFLFLFLFLFFYFILFIILFFKKKKKKIGTIKKSS